MSYLKKYWYIFILIVIGAVTVIAAMTRNKPYHPQQTQPSIAENPQATDTTPVITPSTTAVIMSDVNTSNWKTYRNEEYGFEVRYPEEWIIGEVVDGSLVARLFTPDYEKNPQNNSLLSGGTIDILAQENWQRLNFDQLVNNLDYQFAVPLVRSEAVSTDGGLQFGRRLFKGTHPEQESSVLLQALSTGLVDSGKYIISIRLSATGPAQDEIFMQYNSMLKKLTEI